MSFALLLFKACLAVSTIISEVVKGTSTRTQVFTENKQISVPKERLETAKEALKRRSAKLKEHQSKLSKAIGSDVYNGVNIFEGTTPMSNTGGSSASPHGSNALDGIAPNDAGVDISSFGLPTGIWKKLAGS